MKRQWPNYKNNLGKKIPSNDGIFVDFYVLVNAMKSLYDILGVPRHASTDDIKTAYRRLIRQHHPDTGVYDAHKVLELNHAYEILKDPQKRRDYDQTQTGTEFWQFLDKATKGFRQNVKENLKDNAQFFKDLKAKHFTNFDDHVGVWVYPWQALLGDKVAIRTDFHHLLVPMPAFEKQLTLTINGAGKPKGDGSFGDLVVDFFIKVPPADSLTNEQKTALKQLFSTHKNPKSSAD